MIQPLKSLKTTWLVYWIDLEEPVSAGKEYFLPTLLIVCDASGAPLAPPDILEELDQVRVESFLIKLFEKLGAPDRLAICASEDWEDEGWRNFSEDHRVEIRFQKFDRRGPEELRALAKTVVLRFARENGPDHGAEVARGLVSTAMRLRSPHKKLALLRAALERDPDCSAARIELADAEFQQGNWKNCLGLYDEVITREETRWNNTRPAWWTDRATRPMLRAYYGRAMAYWHQGRHPDAAAQFEIMLRLNPRDNQGARFFIPLLHLLSENNESAQRYYEEYEKNYAQDYAEPAFLFGWGLALALAGDETEAKAKYRAGMLKNIYIAPMLLEEPEPSRLLWHPNDRAEPNYASDFIDSYAVLWDREASASRLLREAWHDMRARVMEIAALRERMADFQDQRYEPDYKQLWQKFVAEDEQLCDIARL